MDKPEKIINDDWKELEEKSFEKNGLISLDLKDGDSHTVIQGNDVSFRDDLCLDFLAVINLEDNLILLSVSDSEGFGYCARGEILKINTGCMVLTKEKLYLKVYRLMKKISSICWKRVTREKRSFHGRDCFDWVEPAGKERLRSLSVVN